MKGLTIGDYSVGARVGSGGVGDVYRATDTMLERDVAIKFLRPGLGAQAELVERFRSEARTLAQLHHPNIATLYALHREGDTLAMVMELVDGKTVSTLLAERGRFELRIALAIFFQALDGIGCAHESGVVHRDIKPSNLMLNRAGVLKVMDFGIARCIGADRVTRAGNTVGTAQYMPPEQVQGRETDARSDIYALSIVLYEMLTDRLPFQHEVEYEVMRAQVESEPVPPRVHAPDTPEAVEAAILRGLAKNPDERFASTAELRVALLDALGGPLDVGASVLGAFVGSRPPEGSAPDGHTELLLADTSDTDEDALVCESPLEFDPVQECAEGTTPSPAPRTTVWELPEEAPDEDASPSPPVGSAATADPDHAGSCEPAIDDRARVPAPPPDETRESSAAEPKADASQVPTTAPPAPVLRRVPSGVRTGLQIAAMLLITLSIGTPTAPGRGARVSSTETPIPPPSASPERSSPLRPELARLQLPLTWIDRGSLTPPLGSPSIAHTSAPGAPEPRAALEPAHPEGATRDTRAIPRPPRPKPARLARKARVARADERSDLRNFVEPTSEGEAPEDSRAGEWLIRR